MGESPSAIAGEGSFEPRKERLSPIRLRRVSALKRLSALYANSGGTAGYARPVF